MSDAPLIELRVPVDPASVSVVRTAVASLAARFDFPLDRLEDLRLAANEGCALLLELTGAAGKTMGAVVRSSGTDTLVVDLSREGSTESLPGDDSFAWTVLRALVDEVALSDESGCVHLQLTVSRSGPEQE